MKQATFATVRDYVASQPKAAQAALRRVRSAIRKALPRAQETISYGIPAFKLDGHTVLYFAGWKQHYSLYPAGARLVAAFRKELVPYEFNRRGTIRFLLSEPVPGKLIERIAKFRAREVVESAPAQAASRRKR